MPVEHTAGFGYLRDRLFLLSLGLYAINRLLIKPNLDHYSWLFHGHLNDMLLVPVALPLYLFFYRAIGLRPDNEPPRWWEVALHTVIWIVFFEWLGPVRLHVGVSDPMDAVCMAGGGVVSWMIWQRHTLFSAARPSAR